MLPINRSAVQGDKPLPPPQPRLPARGTAEASSLREHVRSL